jgi:hypothetical protein
MAAPRAGEIVDGYRFKGGNPNSQDSWEEASGAPAAGDIIDGYVFKGGNPNDQASWSEYTEESTPERTFTGTLKDAGISLAKGVIGVPEAAVGLADIVTGGRAGKLAEDVGVRFKDAKDILESGRSEAGQAAKQKFAEADGFIDSAKAAIQNPSVIADAAIESIPLIGAGGVAARGVMSVAPKIGAPIAGAIGEGVAGAGASAEGTRQQTEDGLLTGKQSGLALASGVGTALTGAIGGKLAQKLGITDIDTVLAGDGVEKVNKNLARRLIEGGIAEGVFEEMPQSAQEQVLSNIALDKPLLDGVDKAAALGALTGGAMGSAVQLMPGRDRQEEDRLTISQDPATAAEDDAVAAQMQADWDRQQREEEAQLALDAIPKAETVDDAILLAEAASNVPIVQSAPDAIDITDIVPEINESEAQNVGTDTIAELDSGALATQPDNPEGSGIPVDVGSGGGLLSAGSLADNGGVGAGIDEGGVLPVGDDTLNQAVAPAEVMDGGQIDDEWTAFSQESGSIGIPRAEMPQIRAEVRGPMVNFLNARGIEHEQVEVPANALKPTQAEYSKGKVQKARDYTDTDRSILISEDGHILDGHHQWMARLEDGENVKAIVLKAPIRDLLEQVKEFPSAEVADGAAQIEQSNPVDTQKPADVSDKPVTSLEKDSSWIIRNKETGEVIQETFQKSVADKVNKDKYEAVPALQHLQEMNDSNSKVRRFADASTKNADFYTNDQADVKNSEIAIQRVKPVIDQDQNLEPEAQNEVRELVTSLVKRRAAAQQINKEKMFDAALAAAKELMNGKAVSAGKFKTWKNLLKADTELANILGQLEQMAGQSPDAIAAKERKSRIAAERAKLSKQIDTTKDDILAAMAKLGGLKKDAAKSEFGFDPADMDKQGSGIYRTFNNSDRAKDLDAMREALAELGYPVGETVADFGEALDEAMAGGTVMTSEGIDARMQAEMAERYMQEYNELSDEEQAILDAYVLEATRIFGADRVAQIDAAVAEYMADQPVAAIERELTRVLREEIDIAGQSQGTGADRREQEAASTAEGTTRQADPDGGDQDSAERQGEVDLLGDDTQAAQAVADAAAAKDQRRNSGEDNPEEFTLTGSNRPADVAAARGAQDMFGANGEPTAAAATSTAPEHAAVGVDDRELGEIVEEFNAAQEAMVEGDDKVTHVFDPPKKSEIVRLQDKVRVYTKEKGWMSVAEAKAQIAEWKARAAGQYDDLESRSANNQRVVLSLFDLTGKWSQPWEEAGYQVYRFDIQDDPEVGDINNFSTEFFNDWFGDFDGMDIYAVLAACPCTDFAVSGARHFAAKDEDGRTVASVRLVHQTLRTIEYFKPAVWAIENPVGRIESLGGLPPWRLSFDPNHIGDPYTKKTLLWGRFNADLPIAPVEPTEGSKMHQKYGGKSLATKNARSATPEGFAYGFFVANNAIDHPDMAIANKFDRLDSNLIKQAVDAGITEEEITSAVEDFYYMDLDDDAANDAIRDLIAEKQGESQQDQPTDSNAVPFQDTSDVGIEMIGNRRNRGLTLADVQNANNDTERVAMAVKTKLWERPNYQELVDSGVEPVFAHIIKQIYDSLSNKPAYKGDAMLYNYVETVEAAKKAIDEFLTDKDAMAEMLVAVAVAARQQSWMHQVHGMKSLGQMSSELKANAKALTYLADRIFPENEEGARWGRNNKVGNAKANSTGNRFYQKTIVDLSMFIDAIKAVEQGFPAKQELWERSYRIQEKDGKFELIKKGRYSALSAHDTREEAVEAARDRVKRQREEAFKEPDTPVEKSVRKGREIRTNGNVSSQELKDAIGLKAVNFGNWMKENSNAKERQQHVNSAFDAFHDLAEVLGLPVKAMSLDGMLGLAIGAQGKGRAAAHFIPGFNEINLTRGSGAGSLAHEWAHGLDHYFGVQAGLATTDKPFASWVSGKFNYENATIRPEIVTAFKTIVETMKRTTESVEDAKARLQFSAKAAQERIDKFITDNGLEEKVKGDANAEAALEAIRNGDDGEYVDWPPLKGRRKPQGFTANHVKVIADKLGWDFSQAGDLNSAYISHKYAKESLADEPRLREIHTNYYQEAAKLDSGKKDPYWTTPHELFARAFEMYVADKLAGADQRNDYLVAAWKLAEEANTGDEILDSILNEAKKRYPQGDERKKINDSFDVLFKEIQTKETDAGIALRQDVAQYNRYETDLFGEPLPIKTRRSAAATSGSRDVQPASSVSDTEAPLGQYYVKTIIGQEQQRKLGVNRITTPAEAAAATHYLYKSAVERFDAIVTDENGKPLAVVGGFKGALTQTAVYPSVVIAEAVRVPGAAKIWFSHNHPSGKSDLSTADKALYRMMHSVFEGSGIKPMGLLAVSLNEFHAITDPNDEFNIDFGDIAPPSSEVMVPVIERDMMDSRKSLINVGSPAEAKQVAKNFYEQSQQPAIVMLDAQNNVAAWVPLSEKMTGKLKNTGGLNALYRAISEGNPAGTIIVHGGELDATVSGKVTIAQNIGGALQKIDARPLDVINVNKTQSAAEDGSIYFSGEVYSRTGRGQTDTDAFKRWFGASKVVDTDGKPLVVYHGTQADFTEFSTSPSSRRTKGGKALDNVGAIFFSDDPMVASAYAGVATSNLTGKPFAWPPGSENGGRVMPVYLSLKNPLTIDAKDSLYSDVEPKIAQAKLDGYDGVIMRGVIDQPGASGSLRAYEHTAYIAFRSEQIKSATGNNGDFDPENPNILFSRGGTNGMPLADAQAIVDEIAKKYPAVPKVVVVNSSDELPLDAATKREIQQQRAELQEAYSRYLADPNERNLNATLSAQVNDVEGLFSSDGKIYLNAGAINSEKRLREVFAHEAIGHLSVENMLNEANPKLFGQLVKQVNLLDKSGNKYIRKLAEAVDSTQPGLNATQRAREIIAQIAERGDQDKDMTPVVRGLWEKIRDAIKAFTKLVFNVDMTDQDVRDIVSMANRYAQGEDVMSVFVSGQPAFQRVWHGSPHRFKRFSLDAIGTGEGAQAFGWGLYFSSRKEIAEDYRKKLSNSRIGWTVKGGLFRKGEQIDTLSMSRVTQQVLGENSYKIDDALTSLRLYRNMPGVQKDIDELMRIRKLGGKLTTINPGQLYEVEIPEDDTFLLWDKPLNKQPESVKAVLAEARKYAEDNEASIGISIKNVPDDVLIGEGLYGAIERATGSQEAASKYLNSLGINGIKYLDGISRGKGEGDYNYVVFDDDLVSIAGTAYSRSGREPGQGDTFLTAALEYLARDPDLFQQPSSDKKAIAEIAADIDPGYKVMPMSQGAITAFYQEMIKDDPALAKMRPDRGWEITVPDSASRAGFIFVKGNEVWLDVSRLQPGVDNGNVIYGTAAAYAHNNDKVLIGDPAGFSRKAFFRRTENMLSSALKYGTTKHLRPHPAQLDPTEHFGKTEWAKSLRPIKWKEGDDIHNIKELVYTSWKSAIDNIPSLKDVIYNPDTGAFETSDGEPVTDEDFARRVSEHANGSKNPYSAGSATQKRAALFNTFLREEGRAAGRQTLDRLVDQLSRYPLGITQLRGVMYSRTGRGQPPNTPRQQRLMPSWNAPEASKMDDVIYALQDKHIDLKRVTQDIKKSGNEIDDRWNAYLQEELFHGRTAKRTKDFIKTEIEPLIEDMRMRGVAMADFEEFLWMRHAQERNEQIAKVNPDMPDGGSGVSTKEAKAYLSELPADKKRAYEALAKRVDNITAGTRNTLVNYGLESADTIAAWQGAYKHYVPLMRVDMEEVGGGKGTGAGYSIKGNSSKRATGSKRQVVDILAHLAEQREKAIIRGEKNRVSTALIGLATLNPNKEVWDTERVPTITFVGRDGLVHTTSDPNFKSRDNVVVARIPNKQGEIVERAVTFNEFNDRAMRMSESLKNLDVDSMEEWLARTATWTRYFASINTQYNPVFGIINIIRDVQGALLNLTSTPLNGKKNEVLRNAIPAVKGIYSDLRAIRRGEEATSEWAELWEEFEGQGGKTGYRDMFKNAKMRGEAIEHAIDPTWWQKKPWGKVLTANGVLAVPQQALKDKVWDTMFDWLSDYNETLENGIRLSAYKAALDSGMTKQQASSLAKNLTVNFNRKGQVGRQIGSLYAFFNASVQGTARLSETMFKDGKLSRAGTQILAGGLLLGSMQAMVLAMAGYDEEEPPEFVRDRNFIMPLDWVNNIGGPDLDGKYLTFPMPLGFNVIPATGRITTEWALSGFEDGRKRMFHLFEVFLDMFNPIGNAGWSMQTALPTVLDPAAALFENRDWTGNQIAQKDFNSLDRTPGFTRAKDSASSLSYGMSYGINWLTGGTEFTPGELSPTPDQIDYLIGQLTGGVGREMLKTSTTARALVTGDPLPPYKIPLVGRFYGNSTGQSAQGGKFYNNIAKLNSHDNEIKGRLEQGQSIDEYVEENPEAMLIATGRSAYNEIRKLRKIRDQLKSDNASKADIEELNAQITDIMRMFNEEVESVSSRQ